jgi:hypothetical protein
VGKIDREQFQRILERAIELEAARGDELDERQLFEAARELGLSEASVREALAEVGAPAVPPAQHARPFDSTVSLEPDPRQLRLTIPARGLTRETVLVGAFGSLWSAFMLTWTLTSVGRSLFDLVLGVAFCSAGVAFMLRWMREAWQADELVLEGQRGELCSRLGPFRWRTPLGVAHLRAAWRPEVSTGSGKRRHTEPAHLVLEHGTATYRLMSGRSEAELRWVNEELGRWLVRAGARSRG